MMMRRGSFVRLSEAGIRTPRCANIHHTAVRRGRVPAELRFMRQYLCLMSQNLRFCRSQYRERLCVFSAPTLVILSVADIFRFRVNALLFHVCADSLFPFRPLGGNHMWSVRR